MSSSVPGGNIKQHKHSRPHEHHPPRHHHHHHHHHEGQKQSAQSSTDIGQISNGNISDDCEDDVLLDNLPRGDVESILSLSISRTQSTYQQAAISGTRPPPLPLSSINREFIADGPIRDPSPPKKTFFASQSKTGGLGALAQTKLFRPRASSLGNADHASKEQGDYEKWVSKLQSFSLSSLQLPQLPSFGSNNKEGMDKEKNVTRSKRTGSLLIDSLAKAAAGVSNHFTANSPAQPFNSTSTAATSRKPQFTNTEVASPVLSARQGFAARRNTDVIPDPKVDLTSGHTTSLRRSNSDSSSIRRTVSRTSSIGSDTRFLDVREQANARYKAIKDSILPDIKDSFTFSTPALVKKATSGNLMATAQPVDPLDRLSGDVVIMGGYRGSILKKVKTSPTGEKRVGRTLWIPVKVGFNLQSVDLEVPLDPEAELLMEEKVVATNMLSHLAGVDISRRLIKKLRLNPNVRLHIFAYDWRLSPHLNSEKLVAFMANLPCNRSVSKQEHPSNIGDLWHDDGPFVIAHSLGGLITRHAINRRPDLFKCGGVLYAGVPQRCINVLGPLRNGDSVAFNKDVLNAQANFSFRSTFVFLPEDGQVFVDRRSGNFIDIDLYDPAVWQQYNLSPCVSSTNKPVSTGLLSTASGAMASVLREGKDVREKLSRWAPSSPVPLSVESFRKQPTRDDGAAPSQGSPIPETSETFASESLGNEIQEISATGAGAAAPNMAVHSNATTAQNSCTLPLSVTIPYLERTLRETKKFRSELAFQPALAEQYPPCAVLYSKTTPTVKAARVNGLEGVRTSNYSDLIFGAGDGVVLAREAMLPDGYTCEKRVHCDRGHISLLGDLDAVGQCIGALLEARERNKRRLLRTLGRGAPSSA